MRNVTYLYMEPDGSMNSSVYHPTTGLVASMDGCLADFFGGLGTFDHINTVDVIRAFGTDTKYPESIAKFLDNWFYCVPSADAEDDLPPADAEADLPPADAEDDLPLLITRPLSRGGSTFQRSIMDQDLLHFLVVSALLSLSVQGQRVDSNPAARLLYDEQTPLAGPCRPTGPATDAEPF